MMIWTRKSPGERRTGGISRPAALHGTVAAAWPTGTSQLAIASAACQTCEARAVCGILLGHIEPNPIVNPPSFCPYAAEIAGAKPA